METKSIPQSQSSLGFFGIIRESFKTANRNRKLLVSILLIVFVLFSQLDFAENYILTPVVKDLVLQMAENPNMVHDIAHNNIDRTYDGALNDIRDILLLKLSVYVVSFIIALIFVVATVSSSYEAHTAKVLGAKDVFLKVKESWKRPFVTSFYMLLLTSGVVFLYVISIGLTSILALNSWTLFFFGAVTVSIPVFYVYLAVLWVVSVVVSVVEEGVGGMKAVGRAVELMKGKKLQAFLMMVLFAVGYYGLYVADNALTRYNSKLSMYAHLAIAIPFRNGVFCLFNLFMFVVYTVFYHEWKTSHEEKKEGKGFYVPIASGEA